jgi:hypothetical protein
MLFFHFLLSVPIFCRPFLNNLSCKTCLDIPRNRKDHTAQTAYKSAQNPCKQKITTWSFSCFLHFHLKNLYQILPTNPRTISSYYIINYLNKLTISMLTEKASKAIMLSKIEKKRKLQFNSNLTTGQED